MFQSKPQTVKDAVRIAVEFVAFQNGRCKHGNIRPSLKQLEVHNDHSNSQAIRTDNLRVNRSDQQQH